MSKVFRGVAVSAVLSMITLSAGMARAGGAEGGEEHHNHFFAGANGMALAVFKEGEAYGAFGGGGFFEFTVIENWLEIEAAVHVAAAHGEIEVPVDVLLKKPFHVNKVVHPYIGLGGVVLPVIGQKVYGGLATAAGSYFWLTPHVGLSAELDYNLLAGGGVIKHEAGGTSGVVFGW